VALSTVIGVPLIVWVGFFGYRLRKPIVRWKTWVLPNRRLQVFWEIQPLEDMPKGTMRCDLHLPDGTIRSNISESAVRLEAHKTECSFEYPRDFQLDEFIEGRHKAVFWWQDERYRNPIEVGSKVWDVPAPEQPDSGAP
jgi:hypothetical protein